MGLFSNGPDDADIGSRLLLPTIRRFNDICGAAYSVTVALNTEKLAECSEGFERVVKMGFPAEPGPFKRLGAFAIMAQVWNPFSVSPINGGVPIRPELDLIWGARLVVWALPAIAAVLEIGSDDDGPGVGDVLLPTPHFQVEFIAYLRAMANGVSQLGFVPEDAILLERATATGLMLEACAYVPKNVPHSDASFYSKAASCLEAIADDELMLHDWKFNDPKFLDMVVGWGMED